MTSWLSSWIPGLPKLPSLSDLTFPSSIQRRFISFVLKKTLGHLLQPGQLDVHQIETQVGSGLVQVSDLVLDAKAISQRFEGTPFELEAGTIGSASVRIPWPNPLSSNLNVSFESLKLKFRLLHKPKGCAPDHSTLSDSVVLAADTFIHDELTQREEATLRQSLYMEDPSSIQESDRVSMNPPGSLDPFVSLEDEEGLPIETDPTGVSILTGLIERILAKFELIAVETEVTLVIPFCGALTAMLARLECRTEEDNHRIISATGFKIVVSNFNLSPSPASSDESLGAPGEDLSQSIAELSPLRSSTLSTASLYQSAISEAPYPLASSETSEGVTILSLGEDPFTIEIHASSDEERRDAVSGETSKGFPETLQISVSAGIIATTLCPLQAATLLTFAERLQKLSNPERKMLAKPSTHDPESIRMTIAVKIRGIVGLVVFSDPVSRDSVQLEEFFQHPLQPPLLACDSMQVHFDGLNATVYNQPNNFPRATPHPTFEAEMSEISIFWFQKSVTSSRGVAALPMILSDPHLQQQSPSQRATSVFNVEEDDPSLCNIRDWAKIADSTPNPALWRVKAHSTERFEPALRISVSALMQKGSTSSSSGTSVYLEPLHILITIEQLHTLANFFSDITQRQSQLQDALQDTSEESTPSNTPHPASPSSFPEPFPAGKSNVTFDSENVPSQHSGFTKLGHNADEAVIPTVSVCCPMIRIQIRCCSPLRYTPRAGCLIVDFLEFRTQIFNSQVADSGCNPENWLKSESRLISLAYAPTDSNKAMSFLSLGATLERHPSVNLIPALALPLSKSSDGCEVFVPALDLRISKDVIEGLQYWADDAAQYGEQVARSPKQTSNPIGSQFSAKSRTASPTKRSSGDIAHTVHVRVLNASIGILLSEAQPSVDREALTLTASEADILIDLAPNSMDEMILSFRLSRLSLTRTFGDATDEIIGLTNPFISQVDPVINLRLSSSSIPDTSGKESHVNLVLCGLTYRLTPELGWIERLAFAVRTPPGVFESVVPNDRTRISVALKDASLQLLTTGHSGSTVILFSEVDLNTTLRPGQSKPNVDARLQNLAILSVDEVNPNMPVPNEMSRSVWQSRGYALIFEAQRSSLSFSGEDGSKVHLVGGTVFVHLCADTLAYTLAFCSQFTSAFAPQEVPVNPIPAPKVHEDLRRVTDSGLLSSIDDTAFKKNPDIGPIPDLIQDDLPTNMDYIDEFFGTAAGLREIRDNDFDDFGVDETYPTPSEETHSPKVVSKIGGETIRMFQDRLSTIDDYFNDLPPEPLGDHFARRKTTFRLEVREINLRALLYDGYDWKSTQDTIKKEIKEIRKRLAKIRQLVADGQEHEPLPDQIGTVLFNSIYVGLDENTEELKGAALLDAIDEELKDEDEWSSSGSWQSLRPAPDITDVKGQKTRSHPHTRQLTRSKSPSIEISLIQVDGEVATYVPVDDLVSRIFFNVQDLEILDHIKSSTWSKFLTALRSDSRGNIRETGSSMIRLELCSVRPVLTHSSTEMRLKAKILPLRLYVDQDALDFLKAFFNFKDPRIQDSSEPDNTYFQLAEVFPVDLKLDYKPRRVNYRALREGRTIELMNFFHFDGAEMTLRHITIAGITGWVKFFDLLNDLWTPDVKATQLMDVISGVAPIRSVVNVGSGIADLVLLPIAQYKKDGRILRGVQKGATAFVQSTAIEAVKLGARLATGTQVILEEAEGILGNQYKAPITAEAVNISAGVGDTEEDDYQELISRYAEQPLDVLEGVQSAYRSLRSNLNSAAQTILAVPMEVYERSGEEGAVRSVIRAVPIAVLKPMIGATEAVSKALLGVHNTLDPEVRHENQAKYKHR